MTTYKIFVLIKRYWNILVILYKKNKNNLFERDMLRENLKKMLTRDNNHLQPMLKYPMKRTL